MNLENMHMEELKDQINEIDRISQIIIANEEKMKEFKDYNNLKIAGYVFVQMFNMFLSNLNLVDGNTAFYVSILNHLVWAYISSVYYGTFYSNTMNVRELEKENKRLMSIDLQNQNEKSDILEELRRRVETVYQSEENKMLSQRISDLRAWKFSLLNAGETQNEKRFVYTKK